MATILRGKNPRKPHTVRYQDNGRQRERSFRTAGEARDFVAKFEHDSRCGIFVDPSKGRADFCAAVEQWIARHPGNAGTKANYRAIYRAHIGPAFAGRTLAQVSQDRAAVQDFLTVTMPGKVCQARVGAARGIILGVIGEAVKAGQIPPVHRLAGIEIAAAGRPSREFIHASHAQVSGIAAGLRRRDLALAVWLMRGAGLRVSEALAVNLRAFRDNGRTLRVSEQVATDGSGTGPLKHRKAGEYRDVPVPGWLAGMVRDHVATFGTPLDGYLFHGRGRHPFVGYSAFRRSFVLAATKAGLPGTYGFTSYGTATHPRA
jgi:integrase